MKALPIGIQTFADIRGDDYVYIDKTPHAYALTRNSKGFYFLSRPRRFGKSLFLDTLHQLFACRRELFEGLFIQDKWDWSKPYPVIRISFGGGVIADRADLLGMIAEQMRRNSEDLNIDCGRAFTDRACFSELIRLAHQHYGRQVVVLVDEYDKPILDQIEKPELAADIRDLLKDFYSVIKDSEQHIRLVFLTGVSKFSKVSLFSGLNNLQDLTLNTDYATVCGYTHADIKTHFVEHLQGVDYDQLRDWYNGYQWLGDPLYNPFDILLFISNNRMYRSYWFETGSPSFLIKLFRKNKYFLPELKGVIANDDLLSSFDIEHINPVTLLFQTGYLTIKHYEAQAGNLYFELDTPNREVRVALNNQCFIGYTQILTQGPTLQRSALPLLLNGDLEGLHKHIRRIFAAIPYRNFTAIDLPHYEGYYASVLYAFFASLGFEVIPEDVTNHGQVDLTIKTEAHIYILEIKVVDQQTITGNPALEQLLERDYAEKYRGLTAVTIHQIGMVFSSETRNVIAFTSKT